MNNPDVHVLAHLTGVNHVTASTGTGEPNEKQRRLKHISTIIDYLKGQRVWRTWAVLCDKLALEEEVQADAKFEARLQADIANNTKLMNRKQDGTGVIEYHYKSTHPHIVDEDTLIAHIYRHPFGCSKDEFMDVYKDVEKDLERLLKSDEIYQLPKLPSRDPARDHDKPAKQIASEKKSWEEAVRMPKNLVVFPRQKELEIQVDAGIKKMWSEVKMPSAQTDLEEYLYRNGHITEAQFKHGHKEKSRRMLAEYQGNRANSGQTTQKQRKRNFNKIKVTNTHLIGQYEWFGKTQVGQMGGQVQQRR